VLTQNKWPKKNIFFKPVGRLWLDLIQSSVEIFDVGNILDACFLWGKIFYFF